MVRFALLLCATVIAMAAWADRPAHKPITVTLDGKAVEYHSSVVDSDITAGVVVDGKPMVAMRFLMGTLRPDTETYLLQRWGVFKLNDYAFKVGSNLVIREIATPGGGGWVERRMPIAPMILPDHGADRLYIPAIPVLGMLGHGTQWVPETNTLHIRTGQATDQEKSFMY